MGRRSRRFQTVPLNTTGSSYANRSVPISAQRTFNLFPEITPTGITEASLKKWPGLSLFSINFAESACKAARMWNGLLYVVKGGYLYSVDSSGTDLQIGAIAGSGRVFSMSDNGLTLVIATGGTMYQYDGSTLSTVSSVTWRPSTVKFLNERFYTDGDDGGTYVSDVLSTNFDIANIYYTRSLPDTTIGPYIFNQIIYGFGTDSIEPWEPVNTGAPPVARIDGGIVQGVGAASLTGITNTNTHMYFMGNDAIVYRMNSFIAEPLSNSVISTHFKSLDYQNIKADSFVWAGQRFVMFTFYNNNETWVFSETTGAWFEVGVNEASPYPVFGVMDAFETEVVGLSYADGTIYKLNSDTFLMGTVIPEYERVLPCISGDDFGSPQSVLEMSKLVLSVETGSPVDPGATPITHASYPDAKIMVEPSFDGGYTYSKEITLSLGTLGDFTRPIEVHIMKQFRRATFRIKITDPLNRFSLYSAAIDVREVDT